MLCDVIANEKGQHHASQKVVDYRCIENFNNNYLYDDISLTTHDKNHQQFETKRNNMIMLLKLRTCRLKNDVQRLNNN